jgi:oligosaccharide translocation protein RFT1
LLSEPLYLRAISELKVHIRVRAEGAAVVAKTVTSVIFLLALNKEWSLVAFAGGQVAYGAAVLFIFVREYGTHWIFQFRKVTKKVRGK